MIYYKKTVRDLTEEEKIKYLVRPVVQPKLVKEGFHKAVIESARAIVQSNPFSPSGQSVELELEFKVEEGEKEVILDYAVNLKWCENGDLQNLLENLEMLPEEGKMLDVEKLIGMPVKILVTNMIHDGVPHSEIIDVEQYYANDSVYEGR